MAMSVDRYYHFDRILPRHWEDEARKCGYDPDRAVGQVRDLIARVPGESAALINECRAERSATEELEKLVELIAQRCKKLTEIYGAQLMGPDQDRLPGL
jgi:hypothetical protein